MIVPTKLLFEHAYGKYALGAYNINNLEQTMGLFRGNVDSQAPFIIQISKGARAYTDKRMLEAMIRAASEIFPDAIFAVLATRSWNAGASLLIVPDGSASACTALADAANASGRIIRSIRRRSL